MQPNIKFINGFHLRLIAMITMVIDHVGSQFCDNYFLMRGAGRIAFLVYAFLLADGFLHVKDDEKRLVHHIALLFELAVVSEFCYDVMESGFQFGDYLGDQSVIITLILGYLCLLATEKLKGHKLGILCIYILAGISNYVLAGNFNLVGPWLVIAFYWYLKTYENKNWIQRLGILCLIFVIYLPVYFWARAGMCDFPTWCEAMRTHVHWIVFHFVAAGILSLYNGKLGYHSKTFSRIYTWFYPAQALIIGLICWVGFGGPM